LVGIKKKHLINEKEFVKIIQEKETKSEQYSNVFRG